MSHIQTDRGVVADQRRLLHFPVSFFSIVMGLSGVTLAWKGTEQPTLAAIPFVLMLFTSLVMVFITFFYAVKLVRYPSAVMDELRHPVRLNFFPAFSISLLLLSVAWQNYSQISVGLWLCGAVIQFCLTLYVMSSWIHHSHYTLSHANPSWFIPVVGNIIVPITGSHFAYTEVSWFFFSIGLVFWLVLLTIVLYRLFFHEPLPARLTPMLFILLAPPSVGFVSYSGLVGGLDNFGRVLYYIALFLSLLLFSNVLRFIRLPFFLSSWAYSFPVAALTIATKKMFMFTALPFFNVLFMALISILSLLVLWLVVRTCKAVIAGELCRPE